MGSKGQIAGRGASRKPQETDKLAQPPPSRYQNVPEPDFCPENGHVSPRPHPQCTYKDEHALTRHKGAGWHAKPRTLCAPLPPAGRPPPSGPSPAPAARPAAGPAPPPSRRWSCHCLRSCHCCCHWRRAGQQPWWEAALPGRTRLLQAPRARPASWQSASRTHPGGGGGRGSRAHEGCWVPGGRLGCGPTHAIRLGGLTQQEAEGAGSAVTPFLPLS